MATKYEELATRASDVNDLRESSMESDPHTVNRIAAQIKDDIEATCRGGGITETERNALYNLLTAYPLQSNSQDRRTASWSDDRVLADAT